jgi:hypothetical protein
MTSLNHGEQLDHYLDNFEKVAGYKKDSSGD